jgi:hypothetical protein
MPLNGHHTTVQNQRVTVNLDHVDSVNLDHVDSVNLDHVDFGQP